MAQKHRGRREQHWFVSGQCSPVRAALMHALGRRGITAMRVDDLAATALTIRESVLRAIESADVVVVIFTSTPPSPSVMFEMGVAAGLRKRVIALVARGADIPVDVRAFQCVFVDPTHPGEAVEFAVDALATVHGAGYRRARSLPATGSSLGRRRREFVKRVAGLRREVASGATTGAHASERVEELVADILAACDLPVLTQGTPHPARPDFAVWLDELSAPFGNPLLVEVKARPIRRSEWQRIRGQLEGAMTPTGSRCALVVYLGEKPGGIGSIPSEQGTILLVEVDELLKRLATVPLGDVTRALRSEAAHGSGP